jgi:hypothetical protein
VKGGLLEGGGEELRGEGLSWYSMCASKWDGGFKLRRARCSDWGCRIPTRIYGWQREDLCVGEEAAVGVELDEGEEVVD